MFRLNIPIPTPAPVRGGPVDCNGRAGKFDVHLLHYQAQASPMAQQLCAVREKMDFSQRLGDSHNNLTDVVLIHYCSAN